MIIITFPNLHNHRVTLTVNYLNHMRERLSSHKCISGTAIYGNLSRGEWHDRSDIDIRFLRKPGTVSLSCAAIGTLRERFRTFTNKQPIDLFIADDVDFLKKVISDEIPILTLCRDDRLQSIYPTCMERVIQPRDIFWKYLE